MSNNDLTSEDNLKFQFTKSGTQYGYKNSSGTFIPFKNPTGTRSITTNGTYDVTNYASASVNVSTSLSETTLWTNSSPTSTFNAQDVTLNQSLRNFTYLKFITIPYGNTQITTEQSIIIPVNEFVNTSSSTNTFTSPIGMYHWNTYYARGAQMVSNTSIHFMACNQVAGTGQNNSNIIPQKIIGMK